MKKSSEESFLLSVKVLIGYFLEKLDATFTERNMFEGRDFSETVGDFSFYQSARSSSAWNKNNSLSKGYPGGTSKLLNETLREAIKHVVTNKSYFEFWQLKQNSSYQPLEFLKYQEFDSRLKWNNYSVESFLSGRKFSVQTIFGELKLAFTLMSEI